MLSDWVIVIGAGRFGKRAVRLLHGSSKPILVVDKDQDALHSIEKQGITPILSEGVDFLKRRFGELEPETIIVPALPVHLAYEWLADGGVAGLRLERMQVPTEGIISYGAFSWPARDGSLLVSYSNFMCPEDCPEPECCTVTGQRRDLPLYSLLKNVRLKGWATAVIRSRQLAPGLGGYKVKDLKDLSRMVSDASEKRCLVCTSCGCHGVITACKKVYLGAE